MPNDRAIPGSLCGTGRPDRKSVPESAFTAPVMILMSVLLPAPFSPISPWTSPSKRLKETPFSACTPANALVMEFASRRRLIPATSEIQGSNRSFERLHSTPLQFGFLPATIGTWERQRADLDPSFGAAILA